MDWKAFCLGAATPVLIVIFYELINLFMEFFTTKIHRKTCLVCHKYIGSPFRFFIHKHVNGFHKENVDDFAVASLGGRLEHYYNERGI